MAALVYRSGIAESGPQGNGVRFIDYDRQCSSARLRRCAVAGGIVSGRDPSTAAGTSFQDRSVAWRLLDYVAALPATITRDALIQELVAGNDRGKKRQSRQAGRGIANAAAPAPPGTGSFQAPRRPARTRSRDHSCGSS